MNLPWFVWVLLAIVLILLIFALTGNQIHIGTD